MPIVVLPRSSSNGAERSSPTDAVCPRPPGRRSGGKSSAGEWLAVGRRSHSCQFNCSAGAISAAPSAGRPSGRAGGPCHACGRSLIEELDSAALERHRDRRLEIGARDIEGAKRALTAAGLSPTPPPIEGPEPRLELRDTIVASQILAVLGWGAWFPWSVPAILAGAGGAAVEPVGPGGIAMVVLAAILGLAATVAWWERADQTG